LSDLEAAARRYRRKQILPKDEMVTLPGGQSLAVSDILPPL
jgi:hypothetical protein